MGRGFLTTRTAIISDAEMIICRMVYELDDIKAQSECPVCGCVFNVTYKTLRFRRTIECQGCGETVRPIDETPIAKIQALIDDADAAA